MLVARLSRCLAKFIDLFIALLISLFFFPRGIILAVFYLAMADALPRGQSIGKRLIGFSVVDLETSMYCSIRQSAIRNLPIYIPWIFVIFPFWGIFLTVILAIPFYLLEIYFIWTNDKEMHLGDVMADTTVIAYIKENDAVKVSPQWQR